MSPQPSLVEAVYRIIGCREPADPAAVQYSRFVVGWLGRCPGRTELRYHIKMQLKVLLYNDEWEKEREREGEKKRKREGRGRERHRERQREICVALLYLKTNVHCAGLRGFPLFFCSPPSHS